MHTKNILLLAAVATGLALSACRGNKPGSCQCLLPPGATTGAPTASTNTAAPQIFQVRGVVKEVRAADREVVIKHEEIPGYMAAMTMPFDVKDAKELDGLAPGDTVNFRMNVTATDGWIDQIKVLDRGVADTAKPEVPSVRVVRDVDELHEGDAMPDYPFVTESRRPVRLSDFKGQALGLTFLYTRCPYPTFCPRQSRQFAEACAQLKQLLPGPQKRWHLLAISFDPAYDTPAVLHRYAQQYGADPAWLNFCTGEMIDIDAITEQFGTFFARDGEGFSHNVRTVVVDATGHIQRILMGNEWKTADFVAEMVKAAAAK